MEVITDVPTPRSISTMKIAVKTIAITKPTILRIMLIIQKILPTLASLSPELAFLAFNPLNNSERNTTIVF